MSAYVVTAQVKGDFKQLKEQLKQVSKTSKITVDSKGVVKASQETNQLVDAQGRLYTQTVKLDKKTGQLNETLTAQAKRADGLASSFKATLKSAVLFTAAYGALNAVVSNTAEAISSVDKALTEFRKVSELSGGSLDSYSKKLGNMGREVARTRAEMIEASTEFVKSGYSEADSAELARVASLYQNIADEELDAGEAANFIISQMKAFNLTAQDSEHIINAVNEVSNNTAVSSADIATNIGKASAALAVGNNTYEESLALMTGIVEVTRNGAKAARGK